MRRPETVAATALVVGQPLGPRSVALPGRTRTGLTAICGGWPEVGAVPLAEAGVSGAAGGARLGGCRGRHDGRGVLVGVADRAATAAGRAAAAGGMPQVVTVFTTGLASPSLHWITYEHV